MKNILNYIGFQIGWFACVMGAAHGYFWLGPITTVILLSLHISFSGNVKTEIKRLISVAIAGLFLERMALASNTYAYVGGVLPAWIMALWLLFAATLNASLSGLTQRPILAALLGAIAGPLSFRAGVGLGAANYLAAPFEASLVLGTLWAVALPSVFIISRRFS